MTIGPSNTPVARRRLRREMLRLATTHDDTPVFAHVGSVLLGCVLTAAVLGELLGPGR